MNYNESYAIRKTIFGRIYLANQESGDVIDINQITLDIIESIKNGAASREALLSTLCQIYDARPEEIAEDVEEILAVLQEYNVLY